MPLGYFDPMYLLFVGPAMLLAMFAQWRVSSTFNYGMQLRAPMSGAAAARYILDAAGLQSVPVEETHGHLSDHYDPRDRVVRLSTAVYRTPSLAAVGIAAHEVGHAMQHAFGYLPLALRNAAVPAATWGPNIAMGLFLLGFLLAKPAFVLAGIICFSTVLIFQVINLPVEFDASSRAKRLLQEMNIVNREEGYVVSKVLNAAALTYVAGTLQSLMQVLYYVMIYSRMLPRSDDDA